MLGQNGTSHSGEASVAAAAVRGGSDNGIDAAFFTAAREDRTMRNLSIPMLAVAAALLVSGVARADDVVETTGTGEVAVDHGDKADAKKRAQQAALRDAVEKAMGTVIVSDSETQDFELVKDRVLSTSAGYVKSFEVVEEKDAGATFIVKVKAKVGKADLDKDLQAQMLLIRQMGYPRLALLVSEQHIGQAAPSAWWGAQGGGAAPGAVVTIDQRLAENVLIEEWRPRGFTFVDLEALSGKLKAANVVSTNPSANQVRELANITEADIIIMGTAVATENGDLGKLMGDKSGRVSMKSCTAALSLRAFNADSGEIIAAASAQKTANHVSVPTCERNALNQATKAMSAELQGKLLEVWRARQGGASRVRMTVKNIDGYGALNAFKKALATVRGVKGVDQKSFRNGTADLDLQVESGDTESLAGDLEGGRLGKVKARVVGVSANTIDVELVR